uniref:Bm13261 n=1 Tax=Brugia malayi TaxID=6279 RepID=A0A1I9G2A0_BRUMA|nr:Bm13261 [Brugia malayi]
MTLQKVKFFLKTGMTRHNSLIKHSSIPPQEKKEKVSQSSIRFKL